MPTVSDLPKATLRIPVLPVPRTDLHPLGTTSPSGQEFRWSAMEIGLGEETRFYEPPLRVGERLVFAGMALIVESFEVVKTEERWEWLIVCEVREFPEGE